ncbi:tetratricopeptide repeat protein [Cytophagaceae bacterium DM2B3-1]|uniref:Tetratricopeptide repeat protein n=1 Tax=Xanthocytophaga flava TaxID=3048013 RepID=A0ABT7CGU5_9BACT|nr:tetratricopeptide repeat protein [Xanthocytophaga flavus]MDJ1492956.1 tetratricopeptide repeat protein [Xanthocytophaga flavus]
MSVENSVLSQDEDAIQFMNAFLEAEYQLTLAQIQEDLDAEGFKQKVKDLDSHYFSGNVASGILRFKQPGTPGFEDIKSQIQINAPRRLFLVRVHQHDSLGLVYRFYTGTNRKTGISYFYSYYVTRVDQTFKIVARYICSDASTGWEWHAGLRLAKDVLTFLRVYRLHEPHQKNTADYTSEAGTDYKQEVMLDKPQSQIVTASLIPDAEPFETVFERIQMKAEDLNNLAIQKAEEGKLEEALDYYNQALNLSSNNAEILYNRAMLLQDMGEWEEAMDDYDLSLFINPKNVDCLVARASLKEDLGYHEKALEDLAEALRLEPENTTALNNRGYLYRSLGRLEESLQDLHKANQIDPEDTLVIQSLAETYTDAGKYDTAIDWLEKALQKDPALQEEIRNNTLYAPLHTHKRYQQLFNF